MASAFLFNALIACSSKPSGSSDAVASQPVAECVAYDSVMNACIVTALVRIRGPAGVLIR